MAPRRYQTRIVRDDAKIGMPIWYVQQYRECDCPDCDKDGHWMTDSSYLNQAEAERRRDAMWQLL